MKYVNVFLMASGVLTFLWSLLQVIVGNLVSPWNSLLVSVAALVSYVGWLREEARADRWMTRALNAEGELRR